MKNTFVINVAVLGATTAITCRMARLEKHEQDLQKLAVSQHRGSSTNASSDLVETAESSKWVHDGTLPTK